MLMRLRYILEDFGQNKVTIHRHTKLGLNTDRHLRLLMRHRYKAKEFAFKLTSDNMLWLVTEH